MLCRNQFGGVLKNISDVLKKAVMCFIKIRDVLKKIIDALKEINDFLKKIIDAFKKDVICDVEINSVVFLRTSVMLLRKV